MSAAQRDILCRALDLEQKAQDFYVDAREKCPSQLGRAVFNLLAEDKMRLASRMKAIHAALNQGKAWEQACVLVEDESPPRAVFEDLASRHGGDAPVCRLEMDLLLLALDVENVSLKYLEEQLRGTTDPGIRSFLQRAIEEERGHYVLLSDMRYHYEQASETIDRGN